MDFRMKESLIILFDIFPYEITYILSTLYSFYVQKLHTELF